MLKIIKRKAQVWIETVLYTLIAIVLIGLVLGFITPKISESRDNLLVEQSIEAMKALDEKTSFVESKDVGNRVILPEFTLRKGQLIIDAQRNRIEMNIGELSKPYTEPGIEVSFGKVSVLSEEGAKTSNVTLSINYNSDIRYENSNNDKIFSAASTPYKFSFEHKINSNIVPSEDYINIEEIS